MSLGIRSVARWPFCARWKRCQKLPVQAVFAFGQPRVGKCSCAKIYDMAGNASSPLRNITFGIVKMKVQPWLFQGMLTPGLAMNSKMVERGTSPRAEPLLGTTPHFAPPTPQNAERGKRSVMRISA